MTLVSMVRIDHVSLVSPFSSWCGLWSWWANEQPRWVIFPSKKGLLSQTPSQTPRNLTDQRGALLSSVVVDRGRDRGHAVYPSPHAGGGMDVGKLWDGLPTQRWTFARWFKPWPFDPLVGGHLTFEKGHLTHKELPGVCLFDVFFFYRIWSHA